MVFGSSGAGDNDTGTRRVSMYKVLNDSDSLIATHTAIRHSKERNLEHKISARNSPSRETKKLRERHYATTQDLHRSKQPLS